MTAPSSESELLERARAIAGTRLGALAERTAWSVPAHAGADKGWVGQIVEHVLGATASSRASPDFEALGIELKTIPIDGAGEPRETTFVCSAALAGKLEWESSLVRKKLARVLWIPVEAEGSIPIAERRVGSPLLWSPSAEEETILRADFDAIAELIALGYVESITARRGRWLHLRPKARNAEARTWGEDHEGDPLRTLPRGYYLRRELTKKLLEAHFVRGVR
jgi:DNA mismatch repair protein MutH